MDVNPLKMGVLCRMISCDINAKIERHFVNSLFMVMYAVLVISVHASLK
jgi:hypothetical protein